MAAVALAMQLFAIAYYFQYFRLSGYLPAPFFYNKFDTFMDL
jgi:hypothetical protein